MLPETLPQKKEFFNSWYSAYLYTLYFLWGWLAI